MIAQGFWFCRKCHRVSEAVDPGDPYPQCAHCGRRHSLTWMSHTAHRVPRQPVLVPAGSERAHELFNHMREVLA
jgi:hypothetical protein